MAHLEVLRTIERTVRRAGLPYAVSYGFSPHMRIGFSSALGVGVASSEEYFDLLLRSFIPTDQALAALQHASVSDLMVVDAAYVDRQATSLSAALTIALYRVEIDIAHLQPESLRRACDDLIARNSLVYQKKGKERHITIQDKLYGQPQVIVRDNGLAVMLLATRALPSGSLRSDTFVYQVINDALGYHESKEGYAFDITAVTFERCGQWALTEDNKLISAFEVGTPPERVPRERKQRPKNSL